jgi:hypothetical protein
MISLQLLLATRLLWYSQCRLFKALHLRTTVLTYLIGGYCN